MSRRIYLRRLVKQAYRLLLEFYPLAFRTEFEKEMQAVFESEMEEQEGEHPLRLFWREIRHWPGSVIKVHLRGWRRIMTSNERNHEKPLPQRELLAAMIIFLLPLFSLFAVTGISLPEWTNYIILVAFWGCVLFVLGYAVARRLPGWSLPYLGFVLMLGLVFSPIFQRIANWVYPYFLETFGARSRWPISISILYGGIFEFIGALQILLGALILVNLLRLLPFTRAVWDRICADWTQLSFMLYGGLVFYILLTFDEYQQEELWKAGAWACLALGAWLYLQGNGLTQRILALLGGTTAAFWIIAIAKWSLIPLQKWPTGYPIAPSEVTRWVSTADTLLTWLFILGILYAPALINWLPPFDEPVPAKEADTATPQAARHRKPERVTCK